MFFFHEVMSERFDENCACACGGVGYQRTEVGEWGSFSCPKTFLVVGRHISIFIHACNLRKTELDQIQVQVQVLNFIVIISLVLTMASK